MKDDTVYVAVDVRTTGKIIGKDSILSLGAVFVDDPGNIFYREIAPKYSTEHYDFGFLKKTVNGLDCLKGKDISEKLDPNSLEFEPSQILRMISFQCRDHYGAFQDFQKWVFKGVPSGVSSRPILSPAGIYGGQLEEYYQETLREGASPFSEEALDLVSYGEGIRYLGSVPSTIQEDHITSPDNALDGAGVIVKEFNRLREIQRFRKGR